MQIAFVLHRYVIVELLVYLHPLLLQVLQHLRCKCDPKFKIQIIRNLKLVKYFLNNYCVISFLTGGVFEKPSSNYYSLIFFIK